MAKRKPAIRATQKSTKTTATKKRYDGFTFEEKAAMRDRVEEQKAAALDDAESELLAKIAEMREADRAMAERLHAVIKASAPVLSPRTWYGMPAYAKDGKVVCFFQPAQKFKPRNPTPAFANPPTSDEAAI